jgi:hypothetical protein
VGKNDTRGGVKIGPVEGIVEGKGEGNTPGAIAPASPSFGLDNLSVSIMEYFSTYIIENYNPENKDIIFLKKFTKKQDLLKILPYWKEYTSQFYFDESSGFKTLNSAAEPLNDWESKYSAKIDLLGRRFNRLYDYYKNHRLENRNSQCK